jgi:hypothetical protein
MIKKLCSDSYLEKSFAELSKQNISAVTEQLSEVQSGL